MKGFSDEERERIETALLREAREEFARYGFERTRIKDITETVEIGTSTFYQFFESKDELYVAVLQREDERIRSEILSVVDSADSFEAEIRVIVEFFFDELESNQLYYTAIVEEGGPFASPLPEERGQQSYNRTTETFVELAQRWTEDERFRADDPTVLMNTFRSLAPIATQKQQIDRLSGEGAYETMRELLIETLVDGLLVD